MKVGFIGLGAMGQGIAANILKGGHTLTVWNRSPAPVEKLVAMGATAAAEPVDALAGDALFSMLANDAAVHTIGLDGALLDRAAAGLVHVNMATVSVGLARELAAAHAARAGAANGRFRRARRGRAGAAGAQRVWRPVAGLRA